MSGMAAMTISLDDTLLAQVRHSAGEDISGWIAKACRSRLLAEACRAESDWEREHPEEAAKARTELARQYLEVEAEQHARQLAEQAWQRRGGDGEGPSAQDREDAEVSARALLEQAERQLIDRDGEQRD